MESFSKIAIFSLGSKNAFLFRSMSPFLCSFTVGRKLHTTFFFLVLRKGREGQVTDFETANVAI